MFCHQQGRRNPANSITLSLNDASYALLFPLLTGGGCSCKEEECWLPETLTRCIGYTTCLLNSSRVFLGLYR